jgi:PAS domain S-box-containing protein
VNKGDGIIGTFVSNARNWVECREQESEGLAHATWRYGAAIVLTLAALLARKALDPVLGDSYEFMAFFLAVIISGCLCGPGPSLLSMVAGILACAWFFLPPRGSFLIRGAEHWIGLGTYTAMGLVVAWYSWVRRKTEARLIGEIEQRKRAEVALRESEQQHRLLSDTIIQGVVFQDLAGKVVAMNPAAERILRKTKAQLLGQALLSPECHMIREDGSDFPERENPALVALQTGTKVSGVIMGILDPSSKTYHWIDASTVPLFRNGEEKPYQVYTLFDDITERKKTAEVLRATAEQRKLALESAELGTWDYKLASGEVYWDERCRRIFGLWADPMAYETIIDAIHPEDRVRVDDAVKRATSPGSSGNYEIEYRVVWPDGTIRWVFAKGQAYFDGEGKERHAVRFIGTVTDITQRKRLEGQLRAREEDFRKTFELSVAGQAQVSQLSGRFLRVNPKYCKMTGYSQTELLQMSFDALIHEDDRAIARAQFASLVRGETSYLDAEFRFVQKNGDLLDMQMGAAVIWDGDGRPARVTIAINDVTARRQSERALRELQELLPQHILMRPASVSNH